MNFIIFRINYIIFINNNIFYISQIFLNLNPYLFTPIIFINYPDLVFQILMKPSELQENMVSISLKKLTYVFIPVCPFTKWIFYPFRTFQIIKIESFPPVVKKFPSTEKDMLIAYSLCPFKFTAYNLLIN